MLTLSLDSAACSDVSRPGNCKNEQNFLKEPGGLAEGQYQDHPCTCPVTGLSFNTSISWESIAPCSALIHTQSQAPEGGRCVSTRSQRAGYAVWFDRCDHPCVETCNVSVPVWVSACVTLLQIQTIDLVQVHALG